MYVRIYKFNCRTLHDHLMSQEILAKASFHIGTKDIILTAVSTYKFILH